VLGRAETLGSFCNQGLKLRTPWEAIATLLLYFGGNRRRERGLEARQRLNEAAAEEEIDCRSSDS